MCRQPFGVDCLRLTAAYLPVGPGISGSPPIAGSQLYFRMLTRRTRLDRPRQVRNRGN